MNIRRITIKGASGYGPIDEAYEDKLTLTADSISYEYRPHPQSELETNIYRKWTYKTTSPIFKELYRRAAEMVPRYLHDDEVVFVTDIGPTEIVATFGDGRKEKRSFICPSEYFADWFSVIKQMIPGCEYVPAVLLTEQDYEDAD